MQPAGVKAFVVQFRIACAAFACFVLALFALFGFPSKRERDLEQLIAHNATTSATVTSTSCWNHSTVYYEFESGSARYSGSGAGHLSPPHDVDCDKLKPGDQIVVSYNPHDPTVNTSNAPFHEHEIYETRRIALCAWAILVVIFGAYALVRWRLEELDAESRKDDRGDAILARLAAYREHPRKK